MKWNMVFGALVVSVGLCSQSFGFELLDRMLGLNNCGSSCCETSCCEQSCAAEPSCGCQAEPACGCAAEPSCGCESACEPSCCEPACGGCKKGCGLFGGLHGLFDCHRCKKQSCCEAAPSCGCQAEASCGCEAAPSCCEQSCGCGRKHHRLGRGLLGGLFKHKHRRGCCEQSCGCETASAGCSSCNGGDQGHSAPAGEPSPAAEGDDAAPMPPAPMADPSAYNTQGRRVIQASKYVRTR